MPTRLRDFSGTAPASSSIDAPGQAQVGDLGVAVGRDEQVARLHVAVDQTLAMGVVQSFGRLRDDRRRDRRRERSIAADQLAEVGAGHILGDEVVGVALVVGVRRADQVRMIELGLGANLALEGGDRLGRAAILRQHLQRFDAAEHFVLGLEHVAHAALADRVDDAIGAERELGAAFLQLLDLPAIEIAELDQPLAELFVEHFGDGLRTVGRGVHESGKSIVQLLPGQQAACERRVLEHGFGHGRVLPSEIFSGRFASLRPPEKGMSSDLVVKCTLAEGPRLVSAKRIPNRKGRGDQCLGGRASLATLSYE